MKDFSTFINENHEDLEVGDVVTYFLNKDNVFRPQEGLNSELNLLSGIIIAEKDYQDFVVVEFFHKFRHGHNGNGVGKDGYCWDVPKRLLKRGRLSKKMKEDIKKREEELKLKHMEVDPYGEEDWLEDIF